MKVRATPVFADGAAGRVAAMAGAVATFLLASCGYVGAPLAPSLDMPQRVTDLVAAERGDKILTQFTIPPMTTEGLVLKSVRSIDLRAGVAPNPWNADVWAAGAKRIDVPAAGAGPVTKEFSAREWIGKTVVIAVRATGPKGKTSDWSNLRTLPIEPPLATPAGFKAVNAPLGVELSWQGSGPQYHVFRAAGDAPPEPLADTESTTWADSQIQYGASYRYYVQAFSGELQQSDVAGPAEVTPEDIFAPSVPGGLTAEPGTSSIELSWERNTEPRFQGYNVYRSAANGPFEKIASLVTAPAYSDHAVESGKQYRYAVSAVGVNGKESDRSAPVEITAQ